MLTLQARFLPQVQFVRGHNVQAMTTGRDMTVEWPRSTRIDPRQLTAAIRSALDVEVRLVGPAEGGQVGACFVAWPSGEHSVLSWWPTPSDERWPTVTRVVERLRRDGYPAPRLQQIVPVAGGAVVVQQRVTGRRIAQVTPHVVEQLLDLNDRQRDWFDTTAGGAAELHLTADGAGFCLHGPVRAHSRRAADLLAWIEEIGGSLPEAVFAGRDAVHFDMHPGNVLLATDSDRIAGVIDWTGARVGDCAFDS